MTHHGLRAWRAEVESLVVGGQVGRACCLHVGVRILQPLLQDRLQFVHVLQREGQACNSRPKLGDLGIFPLLTLGLNGIN
jgi:hypothetical protein